MRSWRRGWAPRTRAAERQEAAVEEAVRASVERSRAEAEVDKQSMRLASAKEVEGARLAAADERVRAVLQVEERAFAPASSAARDASAERGRLAAEPRRTRSASTARPAAPRAPPPTLATRKPRTRVASPTIACAAAIAAASRPFASDTSSAIAFASSSR